jgi:zeaxanthin glucosyltransferase
MSRFLIVTLPLAGHVNPTIGIARELTAAGHEVAWLGSEMVLRPMLGADATILPTGSRLYRAQGGQGAAAVKSLWKSFVVPYTRFVLPAVEQAIQTYQPDVLLVDQHAPAGGIVADRYGLPWAALVSSAMELTRPFRALPKVEEWVAEQIDRIWTGAGVPPEQRYDLRFSPHLVIALTSPVLTGPVEFADHYALVGPILADRPPSRDFPWHRLDASRRLVLVALGTLQPDHVTAFYPRVAEALGRLGDRVQGVIATSPATLPDPPPNVVLAPWVPMLELLPRVDAVVCHGGMNTVCETLAHGVPLAIGPLINDQPVTANQVVAAGAGIRYRLRRITVDGLQEMITALLDDPSYRAGAGRVRDDFIAAGGAKTAADRLVRLVRPESAAKPSPVPQRHGTLA